MTKLWTSEEDKVIKENYLSKKTAAELVELLPRRTYFAIRSRANSLGLHRHVEASFDENFFAIPNALNCLISGEIATDGCIQTFNGDRYGRIVFTKCLKDKEYLEKIKTALNHNAKIHERKTKGVIRVVENGIREERNYEGVICNLTMSGPKAMKVIRDLEKHWSLTPRKTLTLKAPKITQEEHIVAYFLGCVFGDGSVVNTLSRAKHKSVSVTLIGTYDLLSFFKNFINKLFPNCLGDIRKPAFDSKVYTYAITGTKAYILFKMFQSLNLGEVSMKRKYDKMISFIEYIENADIGIKITNQIRKNISRPILDFMARNNASFPEKFL